MRQLAEDYPVRLLCEVLQVPPSSYYYQPQPAEDLELREALEQVAMHYPRYGSRRLTAELSRQGFPVNRKRDAFWLATFPRTGLYPHCRAYFNRKRDAFWLTTRD